MIASETEEEIYAALGLPFIPPVLREDMGEIEAAEKGTLPSPIGKVLGDCHVHTSVSGDGRSSIEDVVHGAKARGYRVLCITDHAEGRRPRSVAAREDPGDPAAARRQHDTVARRGAQHRQGGRDRRRRRVPGQFDWCLASVHDHFDMDTAAQTKRIVTAMQDPSVRMIGHLSARMICGRPPSPSISTRSSTRPRRPTPPSMSTVGCPFPKMSTSSPGGSGADAGPWVAQEKIHGAQLAVGIEGDVVRLGKRKEWLDDDDAFFGWQLIRPEVARIARAVAALAPGARVHVYGELLGGGSRGLGSPSPGTA